MEKRCVTQIKLALLCVLGLVFMGCLTVSSPYENGKKLSKAEMPSPDEYTLLFGNMTRGDGYPMDILGDVTEFIQINPALETKRIYPGRSYTMFYLNPVKPDSTMQLIYWEIYGNGVTTYSYPGLQNHKGTITLTAIKPGLQYVGSFNLNRERTEDGETKSSNLIFLERDTPDELEALTRLKPLLAKTSWESLIDKRIEELSHE